MPLIDLDLVRALPLVDIHGDSGPSADYGDFDDQHAEACLRIDHLLSRVWRNTNDLTPHLRAYVLENRFQASDLDIIRSIGEGQYGSVQAVRSILDGRPYALKVVSKLTARRHKTQLFPHHERQLHLLATSRPEIAPALYAAFHTVEDLCIVSELAPYGSLGDVLSVTMTTTIPNSLVKYWARQMIAAIQWVHDSGFVHRDVKPGNFLLYPLSRIKITDFGSAGRLDKRSKQVHTLDCSSLVGTPDYIAPEVLAYARLSTALGCDRTVRTYTHTVDWWSLGATLYEITQGRTPFWAETTASTCENIIAFGSGIGCLSFSNRSPAMGLIARLLSPKRERLGDRGGHLIQGHPFLSTTDEIPSTMWPPPVSQILYEDASRDSFSIDTAVPAATPSRLSSPSVAMRALLGDTPGRSRGAHARDWTGWTFEPRQRDSVAPFPLTSKDTEACSDPERTIDRRPDRNIPSSRWCRPLDSSITADVDATHQVDVASLDTLINWHQAMRVRLEAYDVRLRSSMRAGDNSSCGRSP